MGLLGCDEHFISIPRKVRDESNRCFVLKDYAPAVALFCREDISEEHSAVFGPVSPAGPRLNFNSLEDKVGRINLAMRMRVRDTHNLALIFKNQNVINLSAIA